MKLQVVDLNSFYGPAHILFDIALEVGEGEVVALLGRNGAGKSTTFRSIVGLVENRSGRIVFEGKDVSREPTHAIVVGGLGTIAGALVAGLFLQFVPSWASDLGQALSGAVYGGILIACMFLMPKGIVGSLAVLFGKRRGRRES